MTVDRYRAGCIVRSRVFKAVAKNAHKIIEIDNLYYILFGRTLKPDLEADGLSK